MNKEKSLIDIRKEFKEGRKKGSIKAFLLENGGYAAIKNIPNFINEMKKAGYSRSYIYRVKDQLKKEVKS